MSEHTPQAEPIAPMMLRVCQVAELMQLSEREVRYRASTGRFPQPVRFGRRAVRWHRPTLEAWASAGCPPLDDFKHAS